mmetsp:Transcript_33758/g.81802  ORF Transcript_33758/g.81802 Transcript_33758/m.81802 type:complete len:1699 (-) Transcript_33758:137-5233(-)|eukprot:CAMPEP_0169430018 /NCGR_PEP_ID=MMETSP1042-20121227/2175_1 /TAXON_ID=464988 /ORGANISM="Hemiselmis andersenii, Strain CCMP1180" /LENGTH=1698 /DNA_ID=CAMNT_0009540305 /DNA_START=152 /DNA_END=5248 /DNA_ORIENTATION=+
MDRGAEGKEAEAGPIEVQGSLCDVEAAPNSTREGNGQHSSNTDADAEGGGGRMWFSTPDIFGPTSSVGSGTGAGVGVGTLIDMVDPVSPEREFNNGRPTRRTVSYTNVKDYESAGSGRFSGSRSLRDSGGDGVNAQEEGGAVRTRERFMRRPGKYASFGQLVVSPRSSSNEQDADTRAISSASAEWARDGVPSRDSMLSKIKRASKELVKRADSDKQKRSGRGSMEVARKGSDPTQNVQRRKWGSLDMGKTADGDFTTIRPSLQIARKGIDVWKMHTQADETNDVSTHSHNDEQVRTSVTMLRKRPAKSHSFAGGAQRDESQGGSSLGQTWQKRTWRETVNRTGMEGRPVDLNVLDSAHDNQRQLCGSGPWFYPEPPFLVAYQGRLPPGDSFLRWWDLLLTLSLLYLAFATPLHVAFQKKACGAEVEGAFVVDICVDVVFFLDIVFVFKTAYYSINKEGKIILLEDYRAIAQQYLRTTFFLDVVAQLSMFGTYISCFWPDMDPTLAFILQIFTLLRMARLHRVGRLKTTLARRFKLTNFFFTTIQLVFFVVGLCHYQACIWFLIGSVTDPSNLTEGWALAEGKSNVTFGSAEFSETYVLSMYWSVVTVTGTGYGDYVGNTLYERIYCMIVMITGGFMISIIIGNMGHLIRSADKTLKFKGIKEEVVEYLHSRGVSQGLVANVVRFYDLKFPNKIFFDEESILNSLPKGLSDKIKIQCYSDVLAKSALFHGCNDATIADMSARLTTVYLSIGDVLVRQGQDAEQGIYFVRHGTLQGSYNGTVITQYTEGNPVGVLSTLGLTCEGIRYIETIVAVEECELMQITRAEFVSMIRDHQDLEYSMDVLLQMRLLLMERLLANGVAGAFGTGNLLSRSGRGVLSEFDPTEYQKFLESLHSNDINMALLEAANAACAMAAYEEEALREEALEVLAAQEQAKPMMVNVIVESAASVPKGLCKPDSKAFVRMALHGADTVYLPYRQTKAIAAVKEKHTQRHSTEEGPNRPSPRPSASDVPRMSGSAEGDASGGALSRGVDTSGGRGSPTKRDSKEGSPPRSPSAAVAAHGTGTSSRDSFFSGYNSKDLVESAAQAIVNPGSSAERSMAKVRQPKSVISWHEIMPLKLLDEAVAGPTAVHLQVWVCRTQPKDIVSRLSRFIEAVVQMQPGNDDYHDHHQYLDRQLHQLPGQNKQYAPKTLHSQNLAQFGGLPSRASNLDGRHVGGNIEAEDMSGSDMAQHSVRQSAESGARPSMVRRSSDIPIRVQGSRFGNDGAGEVRAPRRELSDASKVKKHHRLLKDSFSGMGFFRATGSAPHAKDTTSLPTLQTPSTGLARTNHAPETLVATAIVPAHKVWSMVESGETEMFELVPDEGNLQYSEDPKNVSGGKLCVGFSVHKQTDLVRQDSLKLSLLRQNIMARRREKTRHVEQNKKSNSITRLSRHAANSSSRGMSELTTIKAGVGSTSDLPNVSNSNSNSPGAGPSPANTPTSPSHMNRAPPSPPKAYRSPLKHAQTLPGPSELPPLPPQDIPPSFFLGDPPAAPNSSPPSLTRPDAGLTSPGSPGFSLQRQRTEPILSELQRMPLYSMPLHEGEMTEFKTDVGSAGVMDILQGSVSLEGDEAASSRMEPQNEKSVASEAMVEEMKIGLASKESVEQLKAQVKGMEEKLDSLTVMMQRHMDALAQSLYKSNLSPSQTPGASLDDVHLEQDA